MGALTKKEREALEDVFISIHSKGKLDQLQSILHNSIAKIYRIVKTYSKKFKKILFLLYIKNFGR